MRVFLFVSKEKLMIVQQVELPLYLLGIEIILSWTSSGQEKKEIRDLNFQLLIDEKRSIFTSYFSL